MRILGCRRGHGRIGKGRDDELLVMFTDGVEERGDGGRRPQVPLEAQYLVGVHLAFPRQPVPIVDPVGELVVLKPAGKPVARRARDAESALDLVPVQRLLDEGFQQLAVLDHVEEFVSTQSLWWNVPGALFADEFHRRLQDLIEYRVRHGVTCY